MVKKIKLLSKAERIAAEIQRLIGIFQDLDTVSLASIDSVVRRAAYMRITLEDYEADLDAKGYVEMFSQSPSQTPYERERPVARLYNAMLKNYTAIMKQLCDDLPDSVPEDVSKEINEFADGTR